MNDRDYWEECISIAADECALSLTKEQLEALADSASAGHEHYGMAFHTPAWSDRITDVENECKARLAALQKEFDEYREGSEIAVKRALKLSSDANIGINKNGVITRY